MPDPNRPASTAGKGAARSGSMAGLGAALGAALGPKLGMDPVTAAALVSGALTALCGAIGKVARDRIHKGDDGAFWAVLAALL